MHIHLIITIVKISSLMVAAQKNLAPGGQAVQSSRYNAFYYGPDLAVKGPVNDLWYDGCSVTDINKLTAWWGVKFPELAYVTNIEIHYYRYATQRMDGFSLYMSNGTVDADVKSLCYRDTIEGLPNNIQYINCNTLTKNVYFFNNRSSLSQGQALIELCYIAIYGCWKGTWGVDCINPCPAHCIANHCYPGNGSCIWGSGCLHDKSDMNNSVCIEGCEAGLVGQYCNITRYNLATNGIATLSPSNTNHPAYLSVNGNRTGMCSMTSGSNSYLQVNTGYNSIITMIYITFGEFATFINMTYSVYCSNTSDSWNNGIEIYNGERPMDDIYVTAVCRYVIYVPPIINGISKVDVCEIEISGCPLGKYGVNCKVNCSENCMLGSCDLVRGNCTFGCTDGWVGDRCNETCSEGWFGKQCLNECSPHCFVTSCDHVTGECIDGCNKGWTDYNCTEECRPGYFGRNCFESCDGCRSDLCDRFDGFCNVTDSCKPGYIHDQKCNQSCDNSYYGYNCTEKCNCLISTVPCNKSTGMCPGGKCEKGWSGESCNEECSEGYYGSNCLGFCNNCLNTSCGIFEGNCTYGCNDKFSGPQCTDSHPIENPGLITSIIGGFCAAVFVIILTLMLCIVYRKCCRSKKQTNHSYMEQNNKICSSTTVQTEIYENVKGNFSNAETIRLSFTKKHDRKISIENISSNDLPDEEEEGNVNVYGNVISENDICQYKIRIEDLANVIIEKRDDEGFEKEYKMFPKGLIHAHIEGSKEENKAKNRFLTTWPYDHSRVVLKGDTQYDYINANYIDSYHKQKAYIASQGPKRNTLRDFWHMVWQENVCKIVMVTQLEEKGKKKMLPVLATAN